MGGETRSSLGRFEEVHDNNHGKKEEVQKQRVSIEHISTNFMIVDPLTKGLTSKTFIEHVESMNIIVIDNH